MYPGIVPGYKYEIGALSEGGAATLEAAGWSPEDLEFLAEQFVGHVFDWSFKCTPTGGWKTGRGKLSRDHLALHLSGGEWAGPGKETPKSRPAWIATRARSTVRWLALDVDAKQGQDVAPRLEAIAEELGPWSFLARSSRLEWRETGALLTRQGPEGQSFHEIRPGPMRVVDGGRHAYFMLDRPTPYREARQVVEQLLERAGVSLKAGLVELYPAWEQGFRLPFGVGWAILGPDGQPLHGGAEGQPQRDLEWVRAGLLDGWMRRHSVEVWRSRLSTLPPVPATASPPRVAAPAALPAPASERRPMGGRRSGVASPERAAELRAHGLRGPGERHMATLILAHDCRRKGLSVVEALEDVWAFLLDNAGRSATMRDDRPAARRDLEDVIASVYDGKGSPVVGAPVALTEGEVRYILTLSRRIAPKGGYWLDPATGKPLSPKLSRLKGESALFAQMALGKAWWLSQLRKAHHYASRGSRGPENTDRVTARILARMARWLPDTGEGLTIALQQSQVLWEAYKDSHSPILDLLTLDTLRRARLLAQGLGAVATVGKYRPPLRRGGVVVAPGVAQVYQWRGFDFGCAPDDSGRRFHDMPSAVNSLLSPVQIRDTYAGGARRGDVARLREVGTVGAVDGPEAWESSPPLSLVASTLRARLQTAEKSRADLAAAA